MQPNEMERLILVRKKEEIRTLTEELLDLSASPKINRVEITKKITGVLSLLYDIASYSEPANYNLEEINLMANMLSANNLQLLFEIFCSTVNSISFDFTSKDFKIVFPKLDFSIFKTK